MSPLEHIRKSTEEQGPSVKRAADGSHPPGGAGVGFLHAAESRAAGIRFVRLRQNRWRCARCRQHIVSLDSAEIKHGDDIFSRIYTVYFTQAI